MATLTKRGKACVSGLPGALDVILYPVAQSAKISDNYEEEVVKDNLGFDAAWIWRNEHFLLDLGMKLLGDTQAHAVAGGAFLAPGAVVTLSGFDLAILNTAYQIISGGDISLSNTGVGDINFKLRRYADTTQNTLSTTAPS